MPKNQLFKITPDITFINELLKLYGINNINEKKYFTKQDLENINTLEELINIKDILSSYYIPCKSKIYLKDITLKRAIVILRQFIKIVNYTINSKEKFIKGKKTTIYELVPINTSIKIEKEKIITLTFD